MPYVIYGDAGNDQPKIGDINCVVLEGFDHAHVAQLKTVVDADASGSKRNPRPHRGDPR